MSENHQNENVVGHVMEVTQIDHAELLVLCHLHQQLLPSSALAQFHQRLLINYYKNLTTSSQGHLFLYRSGNNLIGAATLIYPNSKLYQQTALRSLQYLIQKPKLILKQICNTFKVDHQLKSIPEVVQLFVTPETQKQSVGKQLLDTALNMAKENGYQMLYVKFPHAKIHLISYYKKRGFSQHHQDQLYLYMKRSC